MAQKCHGNFNFTHGNFNLFTAISISLTAISTYSRQFQHTHGNFNLLTAISICSRQFQLVHGYFNLLTPISQFYLLTRHFQFFHGNAHNIFRFGHHLSATAARRQWPCTKSQNAKSKVDISSRSSKRKVKITNEKSIYKLA